MWYDKIKSHAKGLQRNNKGATAVEFAIIGVPFFALLFNIIEASLYFFAGQVLENSVAETARMVRTGQFTQAQTTEDFRKVLCGRASVLFNCDNLKVYVQIVNEFDQLKRPKMPGKGKPMPPTPKKAIYAGPSKVEMITVLYEWPIVTNFAQKYWSDLDSGKALLSAVVVFRTEPG